MDKLRKEFESTQWIFGKTPKFKVRRSFIVPASVLDSDAGAAGAGLFHVELEVNKGRVDTVTVNTTADSAGNSFGSNEIQALVDSVQGLEFGPHLTQAVHKHLSAAAGTGMSPPKRQFFTDCVYTMTHKFV